MALDISVGQCALHRVSKQLSDSTKQNYGHPKTRLSTESGISIPSPTLFEAFSHDSEDVERVPSSTECAVHLQFLAALHVLRQRILQSEKLDDVFGIKLNKKIVSRKGEMVELKDDTMWTRRQQKWETYVDIAVARFLVWWKKLPENFSSSNEDTNVQLTEENLPPLDILMVWHSFLLNPRWFRRGCGDGRKLLYKINFPWKQIHARLNCSDDSSFSLTTIASTNFETTTSLKSDLHESLLKWQEYPSHHPKGLLGIAAGSGADQPTSARTSSKPSSPAQFRYTYKPGTEGPSEELVEELKDAVLRQCSFVDKMWDKYWIGSPALEGTIRRARDRYNNFLNLFKLYPNTTFVPTLDIDLVWHTHQCSPSQYYTTTCEVAGKFVNHDDSIVQSKLDTGLKDTRNLYRMRFGSEYQICGCWDCEALQSALDDAGGRPDWEAIADRVGEEVAYHRAVEVTRRKKHVITTVR